MVLRKITINKSVKYIPQSEPTKERDFETNQRKNISLPRKQNKRVSQNNKNFIKYFKSGE